MLAFDAYDHTECALRQGKDGQLERSAAKALLQVLSLFPLKSFVELSDGSLARVLRRNPATYALPIVRVWQALPTPGRSEVALRPEFLNQSRVPGAR